MPSPAATPRRARRGQGPAGLLLAPGAGASAEHSSLVAIDQAATALGVRCRRMDFDYRREGRKAPDRPPKLLAALEREADALRRSVPGGGIFVGGRSMGGRIASMAVAAGWQAAGVVCVSYPLHPPGRPDRPRTDHLPSLTVPCLFVSGTRDAFATPEELLAATATIAGPVDHVWLEGGDHGLRRRDAEVAYAVAAWLATRLGTAAPPPSAA